MAGLKGKLRLGFLLILPLSAEATIITSARIGGGPARYRGTDVDTSTSSQQGTLRLQYFDPGSQLFLALDGTAFRFAPSARLGFNKPIHGNNVTLSLGLYTEPWAFWLGGGGGQMRSYERPDPEADDPVRYGNLEWQIGTSLDFYRAAYGKIEGCILWRRLQPDEEWRQLYALSWIDAWQFELGFKFLDW